MKRLFVTGGLFLALALAGSAARAQTGTARGKIMDDKGQPIVDAIVTIEYQGGVTRKYETKTNKKGEYTQVGIYPGVYKVTVTKEGYQGGVLDARISLGEPTYLNDMKLMTKSAAQAAAAGADKGRAELSAAFKNATDLTQAGKYDEAIAAYNQILATNPSIPEVQYNLGYIYTQKKDWANAEAAYKKALELKPSYNEASLGLARVYQESGQGEKAVELMNKAGAANEATPRSSSTWACSTSTRARARRPSPRSRSRRRPTPPTPSRISTSARSSSARTRSPTPSAASRSTSP